MARVRVSFDGHLRLASHEQERAAALDERVTLGSDRSAPALSPMELLGASLAGCMLDSMRTLAARHPHLDLTGASIEVEIRTSERGAMRVEAIETLVHLPRELARRDRVRLRRAAESCPIKHALSPAIPLRVSYRHP